MKKKHIIDAGIREYFQCWFRNNIVTLFLCLFHAFSLIGCQKNFRDTNDFIPTKYSDSFPELGSDYILNLPHGEILEMIYVHAGSFTMGSLRETVHGKTRDETPHIVFLDNSFWLGRYEVTQDQYQSLMGKNPSYFRGHDLPVDSVEWKAAMQFCKRLNLIEKAAGRLPDGYVYTLPTEAQWEYACRAGSDTAYNNFSNDELDSSLANINDNFLYGDLSRLSSRGKTVPVGQFSANSWGFYDMHGNVSEWCLDALDFGANGKFVVCQTYVDNSRNPLNIIGAYRATRGGGWNSTPFSSRSSSRFAMTPDFSLLRLLKPSSFNVISAMFFLSPVAPLYVPFSLPKVKKIFSQYGFRLALAQAKENRSYPSQKENHLLHKTITVNSSIEPVNHSGERNLLLSDQNLLNSSNYYCDYLVIDLSAGPKASSYPVRQTNTPPLFLTNDDCRTKELWLRRLSPGTFIMGSPEDEIGHLRGEEQREIILTKPFYIGIFEVTQMQWWLVLGENPSYYLGTDRPVESITYEMIRGACDEGIDWPQTHFSVSLGSFVGMLREKTGILFDLPTEAQWEYACRAGTTTALNSGKNLLDKKSCLNLSPLGRYAYTQRVAGSYKQHTRVGSYIPNAWGLYDMHGNVQEFCLDYWSTAYNEKEALIDPAGVGLGRVCRGGGFQDNAMWSRSASRSAAWLGRKKCDIGFRVVCH